MSEFVKTEYRSIQRLNVSARCECLFQPEPPACSLFLSEVGFIRCVDVAVVVTFLQSVFTPIGFGLCLSVMIFVTVFFFNVSFEMLKYEQLNETRKNRLLRAHYIHVDIKDN